MPSKIPQHVKDLLAKHSAKLKMFGGVKSSDSWKDQSEVEEELDITPYALPAPTTKKSGMTPKGSTVELPRTQKATGIAVIAQAGWTMPKFYIVRTVEDAIAAFQALKDAGYDPFCRPCPARPRHGFIDSRICKTADQVAKLMKLTLKTDPKGEMVLMQAIDAKFSICWVPGQVAIGLGNDGATAGKDCLVIPLDGTLRESERILAERAKVKLTDAKKPEVPYVEVVQPSGGPMYYTQMRGGPAVPSSTGNYIPRTYKVKRVVEAVGSLEEWEIVAQKKLKEGDVIWHPGGWSGTHYAVHTRLYASHAAILYGIKDDDHDGKKPSVGDTLKKNTDVALPPDPAQLSAGFSHGWAFEMRLEDAKSYMAAVLTGLHHSSAMTGENSWYVGMAAALLLRLGAAAAVGELQYKGGGFHGGHTAKYQWCFRNPKKARLVLRDAYEWFYNHKHGGAIGGKAWANCVAGVEALDNAVYDLIRNPTQENAVRVVSELNTAVNQAHNTSGAGKWLNKFASASLFDKAAAGDPHVAIEAAPVFYRIWDETDEDGFNDSIQEWKKAERLNLAYYANPDAAKAAADLGFSPADIGRKFWAETGEKGEIPGKWEFTLQSFLPADTSKPVVALSVEGGDKYRFSVDAVKAGFKYTPTAADQKRKSDWWVLWHQIND